MKRIVLIGAQSNLGKNFVRCLGHKYDIFGVARKHASGSAGLVVSDYAEIPKSVFEGTDVVVNCVGTVRAPSSAELEYVNHTVAVNAAVRAQAAGVRHFVQFSSLSVYGPVKHIDGTTPEVPKSEYGKTKLKADISLRNMDGPDFTIAFVRPPIIYGGGMGGKISQLMRFMSRLRFFVVPNREINRASVHVSKLVAALDVIIEHECAGIFLVADEEDMTIPQVAKITAAVIGKSVHLIRLPWIFFVPAKYLVKSFFNSICVSQTVEPTPLPGLGGKGITSLAAGLEALAEETLRPDRR